MSPLRAVTGAGTCVFLFGFRGVLEDLFCAWEKLPTTAFLKNLIFDLSIVTSFKTCFFSLGFEVHLILFYLQNWRIFFFFKFYLFIYLFMAVLDLRFCARAFSSCGKWGPLFIAVRGPLIIAASRCGAQTPDAQAQ